MKIIAKRYHDFSCGHTVTGHKAFDEQGKEVEKKGPCSGLHGHNYRVTFHVEAEELDDVGRVLDFSVIKAKLCQWVEDNWDHKFLINKEDPRTRYLQSTDPDSLVVCNFNPTAENMALFLLNNIGPGVLQDTNARLVKVELSETRKCSVEVSID